MRKEWPCMMSVSGLSVSFESAVALDNLLYLKQTWNFVSEFSQKQTISSVELRENQANTAVAGGLLPY